MPRCCLSLVIALDELDHTRSRIPLGPPGEGRQLRRVPVGRQLRRDCPDGIGPCTRRGRQLMRPAVTYISTSRPSATAEKLSVALVAAPPGRER